MHSISYLLDVFREQLIYPDLRRAVVDLRLEFDPTMVLVEKAGSSFSLYQDLRKEGADWQDLRKEGADWIFNLHPKRDKVSRLTHQSAKIEAGHVYLPKKAQWLVAFESEVAAFPNGKHDDQVDSLSQFLRALDLRPQGTPP